MANRDARGGLRCRTWIDFEVTFGLWKVERTDRLEVRRPSGVKTTLENLSASTERRVVREE